MIGRYAKLGVYKELLQTRDFFRIVVAGLLALASYIVDRGQHSASLLGNGLALAAVAINGVPIIIGAVKGLLKRKVNVDELVAIAITAALFQGEYLTAAVVSFVMVFGALIEEAATKRARKAIRSLVEISPETATIVRDGKTKEVTVDKVAVGDVLLVRPGERIPVDGQILEGITAVDESSMTGEPIPAEKTVGDEVFAGSLNQNGVIEIQAEKIGKDTTLGKVIRLVTEAEAQRPETVRIIDRYAKWFTPAILSAALLTFIITGQVDRAITVLIVGCPCALLLAAPTAIVAALGRAARSGILVKGGLFLETVGRAKAVLFDKTGTLTEGKPRVDEIATIEGISAESVLEQAACVEQNSVHPLARAVLKAANYAKITLTKAQDMFTQIGLGVRAKVNGTQIEVGSAYIGGGVMSLPMPLRDDLARFQDRGSTPLVVYEDSRAVGVLSVADQIRESASDTVSRLSSMGIDQVGMVSGDHEKSAQLVAERIGLNHFWAGLKPDEKPDVVKELQNQGKVVIFVGDGINDAPALATADVGIAMGAAGSDVALETADIALMNDDIGKIPFLIRIGRRMGAIIKWNIVFGLLFNAFAVLASGSGYLTPIWGAIVHNIGSVLVVVSSATILLMRQGK